MEEVRKLKSIIANRGIKRLLECESVATTTPKFTRRRTKSYISYKIPRRIKLQKYEFSKSNLRNSNLVQLSRRHKRRYNLLNKHRLKTPNSSSTKNRKAGWLSTHRWHTKRFKMDNVWGLQICRRNTKRSNRYQFILMFL